MSKLGVRVLLAVPTLSGNRLTPQWVQGFKGLQWPLGSSGGDVWIVDETIAAARNELCRQALLANVDYLVMLGDDVIPPPEMLLLMLDKIGKVYPTEEGVSARASMITGVYWTKTAPSEPYLWNGLLKGSHRDWVAGEFFPVDLAGCDALMLETAMLRELPEPWFSTDWVWEPGQKPSAIATEDFYFYTKARRHGFRLFCDSAIQCAHQDRDTGMLFKLERTMPQAGGVPEAGGDGMLIAEVGAGTWTPAYAHGSTVVRFDMRAEVNPDVRCDVRAIPDEHFGRYDIVHASHVLEHFPRAEAPVLVRHWARLLKPGGQLVVVVPNLTHAMRRIVAAEDGHGGTDNYDWAQVYGDQAHPGPAHEHLNGFTARKLAGLLRMHPCLGDIAVAETLHDGEPGLNLRATARLLRADEPEAISEWWDEIRAKEAVATPEYGGETPSADGHVDVYLDGALIGEAAVDAINNEIEHVY